MQVHSYQPGGYLAPFVETFWYQQSNDGPHAMERLLPDGAMELVIALGDAPLPLYDSAALTKLHTYADGLISGAHSTSFAIETHYAGGLIGAHFKPGGAFPLLGLPASELHNRHVGLADLWGAFSAELRNRLLAGNSPSDRFIILEMALLERLDRNWQQHDAVDFALACFDSAEIANPIAKVADEIGFSQRHFIELFSRQVGMTPKKYSRVQRFQRVVRRLEYSAEIDWVDIALTCGYFDQAHFIRDFRHFSGFTPTAYLAQKGRRFNHIPLSDS